MRQMDDNLIVRIATIQAIVLSLLFTAATWLQLQHQPTILVCFLLDKNKIKKHLIHIKKIASGLFWNSATKLY